MVMSKLDPFADLVILRDAMDRLFDQSFVRPRRPALAERASVRAIPINLYEKGGDYVVKAHLPGVKAEDVDINADQGTLTISAHVPGEIEQEESKSYKWLLAELGYGDVNRTVSLPAPIDSSKIEATVENGVLTLTIPKAEEAKPKKITVKSR